MFDGTPCAMKVARTVWGGGKPGDDIKGLPSSFGTEHTIYLSISLLPLGLPPAPFAGQSDDRGHHGIQLALRLAALCGGAGNL